MWNPILYYPGHYLWTHLTSMSSISRWNHFRLTTLLAEGGTGFLGFQPQIWFKGNWQRTILFAWVFGETVRKATCPKLCYTCGHHDIQNAFHIIGSWWGESTGHQWIPLTKINNVKLYLLLARKLLSKQSSCPWFETLCHLCNITVMTQQHVVYFCIFVMHLYVWK